MEGLTENKPMLYSVFGSALGVFALAANLMPELNEQIQLVQLPDDVSFGLEPLELMSIFQFRKTLVACVVGDFVVTFAIDRILNFLIGDMRA